MKNIEKILAVAKLRNYPVIIMEEGEAYVLMPWDMYETEFVGNPSAPSMPNRGEQNFNDVDSVQKEHNPPPQTEAHAPSWSEETTPKPISKKTELLPPMIRTSPTSVREILNERVENGFSQAGSARSDIPSKKGTTPDDVDEYFFEEV
ncbi:MAG: hypothetical protein NUV82_02560 [Candidatus Komeilibacteria bacterium]|nr:hypothetical protein [Candidatus Komeilibacteria bacterium]